MRNGTLTILAKVEATRRDALQGLLDALERQRSPVFPALPGLHFARLALLDCRAREGNVKESYLLLATDFVSDRRPRELETCFIDDLLDALDTRGMAQQFEEIFQHCEDFPGLADRAAARAFLLNRRKRYSARHVAFPYRWQTPESIHEAVRVREDLEQQVDALPGGSVTLEQGRELALSRDDGMARRHLQSARLRAAVATLNPFNVLLTLRAHWKAHVYERRQTKGPAIPGRRWDEPLPFERNRLAPDEQVQNPLTQVVPLEVGALGALALRLGLSIVNVRLRRYLVGLNRLQGIHFARWVVFKAAGRHHLLFLSCYDGTWDGYIGAFFDDLPVRALLEDMWRGSARLAEACRTLDTFKAWILARQFPTSVFYSAHQALRLGIADIHQALQVRALVDGTRPEEELAAYLRSGICGPEVRQMSIKEALTEIMCALRHWMGKETRNVSATGFRWCVVPGDAPGEHRERGAGRRSADRDPRVPESSGLPVPGDLAGACWQREGVVET